MVGRAEELLAAAAEAFVDDRRVVGWWERAALVGTAFLQWCLAYMMAKAIVLEVERPFLSRQQMRYRNRKGIPLPKPWHVVRVDPRYRRAADDEGSGIGGRSHSYRYDVIGHLRVGLHRVGRQKPDGTYDHRETIEWVPPHQRGLANDVYVPKTYAVNAGRKVPKEIRG